VRGAHLFLPAAALALGCTPEQADRKERMDEPVATFYRIAREELAGPGAEDAPRARERLAQLAPPERHAAAQIIAQDADTRVSAIGIDRLMKDGFEDEAVRALARRVAAGDDLAAFGYQWAHEDDETLGLRMYVKICRHLLEGLERYRADERVPVEGFLKDGGFGEPLTAFSRSAVEARLARIDALASRKRGVR